MVLYGLADHHGTLRLDVAHSLGVGRAGHPFFITINDGRSQVPTGIRFDRFTVPNIAEATLVATTDTHLGRFRRDDTLHRLV